MKSVIHDWDDDDAHQILSKCRRVTPPDGALLLIEWALSDANTPSHVKFADITMMVLTGGKQRSIEEYRALLEGAGFRLNEVIPTVAELKVIEATAV